MCGSAPRSTNAYSGHHVGTPEGAAAAAADRAYVTELALRWPGVLRLPGELGGAEGVARALRRVREAPGRAARAEALRGGAGAEAGWEAWRAAVAVYKGREGRARLLAEVLEAPELLRAAAEEERAAAAAAAAQEEREEAEQLAAQEAARGGQA